MKAYIIRRLIQGFFLFLGAIVLSFVIMQLAPGNYADRLTQNPQMTPKEVELLKEKYGVNEPIWSQFLKYFVKLLQGDFGGG